MTRILNRIADLNVFSLSYLLGTILGIYFINEFSMFILFLVFFIIFILSVVFRKDRSLLRIFILIVILFFALYRTTAVRKDGLLVGQLTLTGYISEAPMLLENVQIFSFKSSKGDVVVRTERYKDYSYGENLQVSGNYKIVAGKNEVSFPKILKLGGNSGFYGFDLVFRLRDSFRLTLNKILPEPEGSLASGMLLGSSSISDRSFSEALRKTGTSHITSVSGFNISIILGGLIVLLNLVPTKVFLLPTLLIVLVFDLMVGLTAPVLRATFMGVFIMLARLLGRQQHTTDALFLSAALISIADPLSLQTPSFQLSFLATVGIVYLYPYVLKIFKGIPASIANDISVSLSAQIMVLPVVIYHFGVLSVISPIANLFVSWTVIPIMVFTFLAGVLGLIYLPLGQIIGALDLVVLTYFVRVINFLASIPWSVLYL